MLKTLKPSSSELTLAYPEVRSEFEVQALVYWKLLEAGLDVRGEVAVKGGFDRRRRESTCRLDLVVYKDGIAQCIIEVKARPVLHKTSVEDTRQGQRYPCFGIPVYFVYGVEGAASIVALLTTGRV